MVFSSITYNRPFLPIESTVALTGYVGPGDIVSGATAWWGLRAYSSAATGKNCVRIRRASDSAEQNFITLSSGAVDVASITTFLTATTGFVVTLYDQTGNGHDLTQATAASQPTFTLSGLGSLPIMGFVGASDLKLTGAAFSPTLAQQWSTSVVFNWNGVGSSSSYEGLLLSNNGSSGVFVRSNTSKIEIYAGLDGLGQTISPATWYSFSGVANSASSVTYQDGSGQTVNASTAAFGATGIALGDDGSAGVAAAFSGSMVEAGIWPIGFTQNNATSISANQHSYWGF